MVHAPGHPGPLKLILQSGQVEIVTSDTRPRLCGTCEDRPRAAQTPPTWPPPERWNPDQLRFLRVADLAEHTLRLVPRLPADAAGIVGIPRSGMLPAGILATHMHLPLYYLDPQRGPVPLQGAGRSANLHRRSGPLVIVDDTTWQGGAMHRARRLLGKTPALYTAVYVRDPRHVDLYAIHHAGSHILEWNIFNNSPLSGSGAFPEFAGGAACDFDGILCEEPIVSDQQDLPRFLQWLAAARPLYVPRQVPVPLVITYRIESWRAATQAWLDRWGIRVQQLLMHPAATVQERDQHLDVAGHKGQTLRRSRCSVMFESDPRQCQAIFDAARKHVICPRTAQVWQAATAAVAASARALQVHQSVALSRLAVITCLFAAAPSRNRAANFRDFAAQFGPAAIDLWTIEGLYAGQAPLTTQTDRSRHVALTSYLWHKERLLNLLVESLPAHYDAVAWIDADLLFSDPPTLAARILDTLTKYPIAQTWQSAEQLGPDDQPAAWWTGQTTIRSMAAANLGRVLADTHAGRSHAGFAWAMRRDTWRNIGGLYDREISGGADSTMASAFWGDHRNGRLAQLNLPMRAAVTTWSDRAYAAIAGRVGCVPGTIRHLYHGTIPNRRYWERLLTISRLGYDPASHLTIEPQQPLRWSPAAPPPLRDWLHHYLTSLRAEDDQLRSRA